MTVLARNLAFIFFPLFLIALGRAAAVVPENAATPSDTYGLSAVSIYFAMLLLLGPVSLLMAGAGRFLEPRDLGTVGVRRLMRCVCYLPLVLCAIVGAVISAIYVLNSASGISACVLALASAAAALQWFWQTPVIRSAD